MIKTAVVTGASSGIGEATARELAGRGWRLIITGRDRRRTEGLARQIGAEPIVADFGDLGDVRRAADEIRDRIPRLHVLMNNAGGSWPHAERTVDGFDLSFQVNHLAPALLTQQLLPLLRATATRADPARVIATSSALARRARSRRLPEMLTVTASTPSGMRAYSLGKLANVYYTRELDRREREHHVLALSFHPGGVATRLGRNSPLLGRLLAGPLRVFLRTPEQGADTLVWLATTEASGVVPGGHYADRRLSAIGELGADLDRESWLWARTAEAIA